jgi:CDP-diacylglycerol---glycerol-3-phosphate 3-phosphatidyltransferase
MSVMINLPNLVTLSRLLLIPVVAFFLYLLALPEWQEYDFLFSVLAGVAFIVAAVTDIIDGYLARKMQLVSLAGKFFDPMADKLIHMTAMVMLIPLGRMSAVLATFLLFREIFITGLRSVAAGEGIIIAADQWGKWKTVWLNVGFSGLIVHHSLFVGTIFQINTRAFGLACLWIGVFCAAVSGWQYTVGFWRTVKQKGL